MSPLARTMGGVGALLITLSGLSPSIGVFVVGSDVIHQAGTAALRLLRRRGPAGGRHRQRLCRTGGGLSGDGGRVHHRRPGAGAVLRLRHAGAEPADLQHRPGHDGAGRRHLPPGPGAGPAGRAHRAGAWWPVHGRLGAERAGERLVTGLFLTVELVSLAVVAWLGFGHAQRGVAALALHPVMLAAGHLVSRPAGEPGRRRGGRHLRLRRLRLGGLSGRGDPRRAQADRRGGVLGPGPGGGVPDRTADRGAGRRAGPGRG